MNYQIDSKVTLNNGIEMPYFGLGLYLTGRGKKTVDAVKWAYETGYRLFDTAQFYHNEKELGDAIKEIGIKREEVFLTSKLWTSNFDYSKTIQTFNETFNKIDAEYLDLFLIYHLSQSVNIGVHLCRKVLITQSLHQLSKTSHLLFCAVCDIIRGK